MSPVGVVRACRCFAVITGSTFCINISLLASEAVSRLRDLF